MSVVAASLGCGAAAERCEGKVRNPDATSVKTVAGSSCWASASIWASVVSLRALERLAIDVPPTCRVNGEEWVLATLAKPLAMLALEPWSPPAICTETLASAPSTKSCCHAHWKGDWAVAWPAIG